MDDAVDLGCLAKTSPGGGLVRNIDLVEGRSLSRDELNAIDCDYGGIVETIDNDDIVTVLEQRERGKGPDVAGTTASHSQYQMLGVRLQLVQGDGGGGASADAPQK